MLAFHPYPHILDTVEQRGELEMISKTETEAMKVLLTLAIDNKNDRDDEAAWRCAVKLVQMLEKHGIVEDGFTKYGQTSER